MALSDVGRARLRRRAVFAIASTAVALQALASSRLLCTPGVLGSRWSLHVLCPPRAWPFLDYPMFKDAHAIGTVLERLSVVARLCDGREVELAPEVPSQRAAADAAIAAVRSGDVERARAAFSAAAPLSDIAELELRRQELVLERDGFRARPFEVLRRSACARAESR